MSNTVYDRNIFSDFFDVDDPNVLSWAENVLNKLYEKGIVPEYIERSGDESDEDFLNLFGTTTHFFAIIVYYARQFEKISENEILLTRFIENLGLFTNTNITETHLQYLFDNYPSEFKKRGTNAITDLLNDTETPNGELLRLISYTDPNEFLFALLEPHTTGWCLSKSSPSFNYTRHCQNMIKGYEVNYGFEDIANYPTSRKDLLSITSNQLTIGVNATTNEKTGIYPLNNLGVDEVWVKIDKSIGYEIIATVSEGGFEEQLNFGAIGYDENKNEIPLLSQENYNSTNMFFEAQRLPNENRDYTIRGIIFAENESRTELGASVSQMQLDIGFGYHMRFNSLSLIKYIVPVLYTENITGSSEVIIKDIKIRPLKFNFTLGKFGVKNIIYMLYKNESIYDQQYIYSNTKGKLISYDNELIDNMYKEI